MATTPASDWKVPHQDLIEEVIDARLAGHEVTSPEDFAEKVGGTVADAAVAAGANPTKAEYDALVGKFNTVLAKLETSGILTP